MPHHANLGDSTPQRACDTCRRRKIRCDKGSPCTNCRNTGSACRTGSKEHKEPRSRVIITKEYEKKIDGIGDRLAKIESCLKQLPVPAGPVLNGVAINAPNISVNALLPPSGSVRGPSAALIGQAASTEYPTEAHDATTNTHSILASKTIEQAVRESPVTYQNPKLASALSSLKNMLDNINDVPNASGTRTKCWTMGPTESSIDPPSRMEIHGILIRAENSLTLAFCPILNTTSLKKWCEHSLDHPRDCGPVRRVLVFGVLFSLCMECSGADLDNAMSERYSALAKMFLGKLETAIADLQLVMPPTFDTVTALIVAASSAIELCKPRLALSLTSAAASMTMSLGYHRYSTMRSDTEESRNKKILLFWMVYIFDTSFSVRLGHAPMIRDHEIAVPMITNGVLPRGFAEVFSYWIEIGRVHCEAVEQLYSPAALRQPFDERSKNASRLTMRLREAWSAREQTAFQPRRYDESNTRFGYLLQGSDSIMHHSTLALVQHATMSSRSSEPPALDAARHALRLSIELRNSFRDLPDYLWSAHCHWTLLHAPFTPFTVTFCHIIANPTAANTALQLLAGFVATLQSLSHLSEGAAKLYSLCDVFQKVADLYVQAKTQEATRIAMTRMNSVQPAMDFMQPAMDDIDEYLSVIGFAPPVTESFPGASANDRHLDADYLNDWFNGNSSLIGLLEQDPISQNWLEPSYGPS